MASFSAVCVFLISLWFGLLVTRQIVRKRTTSHVFWAISLFFSALASLFYCLTLWTSPHSALAFRGYYVMGAMWMPCLMGLGSLALVIPRRRVIFIAVTVALVGLVGSISLLESSISTTALQRLDGGAGTGIILEGAWLIPLIALNTFGAVCVAIVAFVSAWKTICKATAKRFLYGNLWLAGGILVISSAGSAARLGLPQLFWVVMLIGWIITFVGYQLLTPKVGPAG